MLNSLREELQQGKKKIQLTREKCHSTSDSSSNEQPKPMIRPLWTREKGRGETDNPEGHLKKKKL